MADLSVPVSEKDHVQGDSNAAATLVEYGDFQCPDCGVAYPIVKQLQKHFGARLRFVFRNFPLEMHPYAEVAAESAEYAATKGKFWPMHDAIYENQRQLSDKMLLHAAGQIGLDAKLMQGAWGSDALETCVQDDLEGGEDSGVHGTPTFFINGRLWDESYDFESLVEGIEQAIS